MQTSTNETTISTNVEPAPEVDLRIKIAGLWVAVVLLYIYVDLFSLFKPGVLDEIQSGTVWKFEINELFLLMTTILMAIPILMAPLTLWLKPRLNRTVNISVAALYAVISVGSAVGEWSYYLLGGTLEAVLLGVIAYQARNLVKTPSPRSVVATPRQMERV